LPVKEVMQLLLTKR